MSHYLFGAWDVSCHLPLQLEERHSSEIGSKKWSKFFIVSIELEFAYQTEKQNNADVIFEITRARHHFALKVYLSKHNALVLIYIVYVLSNVMSGCVTVLKWYISIQQTFILCHALSFRLFVQLCFALTLRCHLALRQSGTLSIFSLPVSASLALSPLIYLLVFPPSLFFFLPVSPLPGSLPPASQPSLRPSL